MDAEEAMKTMPGHNICELCGTINRPDIDAGADAKWELRCKPCMKSFCKNCTDQITDKGQIGLLQIYKEDFNHEDCDSALRLINKEPITDEGFLSEEARRVCVGVGKYAEEIWQEIYDTAQKYYDTPEYKDVLERHLDEIKNYARTGMQKEWDDLMKKQKDEKRAMRNSILKKKLWNEKMWKEESKILGDKIGRDIGGCPPHKFTQRKKKEE